MRMSTDKRAIDKIYKRRNRYEIPDWQREVVWGLSKKQSLIDSILRGWKLPKFYFLKVSDEPEEYEVLDGQQRLTAIFEFFDNELSLSEKTAEEFGAYYYKDLSDSISDSYDDFEIEFDLIEDAEDEDSKEFFQRLQEGLPLTSSEKLNSMQSNLRDFCRELSKDPFFINKTAVSNKRYGHFDVIVKATCIEIDGIDVGLRYDDLRAVFLSQQSFSNDSKVAKKIVNSIKMLDQAIIYKNDKIKNRSLLQSLITLTARIVEKGKYKTIISKYGKFINHFVDTLTSQIELGNKADDMLLLDFQKTISANTKSGPKIRQNILINKLLTYDPIFIKFFDATEILESGINSQIVKNYNDICKKIENINIHYSNIHGKEFIKITSKTNSAIIKLKEIMNNKNDYEKLIDQLYFLFWEGPGSKLNGNQPESFTDINTLRTSIRHDVSHGKESKAEKRKKEFGNVLRKYSGLTAIEKMDKSHFNMFQLNLYKKINNDLSVIYEKIDSI